MEKVSCPAAGRLAEREKRERRGHGSKECGYPEEGTQCRHRDDTQRRRQVDLKPVIEDSKPSPSAAMSSTSFITAFFLYLSVGLAKKPFRRLSMILP